MTMNDNKENKVQSVNVDPEIVDEEHPEKGGRELRRISVRRISAARLYAGPLPPAEDLKKYNEATPDAADRIIKMAENEQIHRHHREEKELDLNTKFERQGQWFGFVLSILSLLGGFGLIYLDKDGLGALFGVGGIASLVLPFFHNKK